MYVLKRVNKLVLILALILAGVTASCGNNQSYTTDTVGPTVPSGYYFDLTVNPSVVQVGGIVTVTAHVWDANGASVSGQQVVFAGDVYEFDLANGSNTDSSGFVTGYINTATTDVQFEGVRGYVTATVQDMSETANYRVIPERGTGDR